MRLTQSIKPSLPYLALLVIATLAFFQIVFGGNPMVYDMIDCYYPWRFYIGECLQNGIFPYWNPYQDLGYPIHADPSSGTWYPIVWLFGSTVGYSVYTIGFEFFMHVFFGGVGMYILAKNFKIEPRIALLAGISYMLCGIFVGNAQHLTYIVSAAWLPFVLNFYFKLVHETHWRNALYAGLFLFLMMTGGYPAFVIILFYFFLITAGIYHWRTYKSHGLNESFKLFLRHALFVLTTLVLSSGLLIAVWQVSPYLSRLEGFSLDQVLYSPFGPNAFLSFFAPYATVKFPEVFNGDISMINGYFGLVMFLFFVAGLFSKKSFEIKLLLGFALVALTAAVGDALPVRKFLYEYVPMMGVFRFPSVFRLFVILPFILIAANYLDEQYKRKQLLAFRQWRLPASGVALIFLIVLLYLRDRTNLDLWQFFQSVVLDKEGTSILEQHLAFQLILQFFVLVAFVVILLLTKRTKVQIMAITALVTGDLILATQLNTPYTAYYPQVTSKQASSAVRDYPSGFSELSDLTIEQAGKLPSPGTPFWQNYHCFLKEITAEGFNSFSFGTYENLESQHPYIFRTLQQNKLLLLSDRFSNINRMDAEDRDSTYTPDLLYFDRQGVDALRKMSLKHDPHDRAVLRSYSANHFEVETTVKNAQLLTIFQKDYIGWRAMIDGRETELLKSNQNFMSIVVPSGRHKVEFEYKNNAILSAFVLSFSGMIFVIAVAIWNGYRQISLKSRSVS